MKRTIKRISAAVLTGAFAASLAAPLNFKAFADGGTVTISSVEELLAFSKNCTLDSWSKGKTVNLAADLDLDYDEFTPIPIFGGTFNGNGHTISMLRITASGSDMGLFRYIEKGGVIENLNVTGTIAPKGTRGDIGGIAGENRGTIKNSSFNGTVSGEENVGGIAGSNAESGKIISCSSEGAVHGKKGTGGIAGNNAGTLINCANTADVNLTEEISSANTGDMGIGNILGETETVNEATVVNSVFDTGGVVGYSDGVVQSCKNSGSVGYPHVGYNTGGIAGRQSGYLSGCVNDGVINGRKEVGGIVGQTEPYLSITPSEDLLGSLRTELDKLNTMTDDALNSAGEAGNTVYSHLTKIKNFSQTAQNSADSIAGSMGDFVDDNVNAVNMVTADISNAIVIAKPAADDLSDIGTELSEAAGLLSDAAEELGKIPEAAGGASDDVAAAIADLQNCAQNVKNIAADISGALDKLQTSVIEDDAQAFKEAIQALKDAVAASDDIFDQLADAMENIAGIVEWLKEIGEKIPDISEPNISLPDISSPETSEPNISLPDISSPETSEPNISLPDISSPETSEPNFSLPDISRPEISLPDVSLPNISRPEISLPDISLPNTSDLTESTVSRTALSSPDVNAIDTQELTAALKNCVTALEKIADSLPTIISDIDGAKSQLGTALGEAQTAAENLNAALGGFRAAIEDIKPANDNIEKAAELISASFDRVSRAGTLFEHALECVSNAADSLSNTNKKPFKPLSGSVRQDSDNLFDALSAMFGEADELAADLNEQGTELTEKLRAINRQIGVITDLVIDEVGELTDTTSGETIKYIIQDTSDEDAESTREGKVADCRNNGAVEGDRNVGGVAGAMAIEYDLDPEDDVTGKLSARARYETKSVVRGCKNYGEVTAKKDSAGGLVGRMELGTLIGGENYGSVFGADYVGGAAGCANASVRGCYSKARLSGSSYIGGIAGFAERLSGCRAITTIVDGGEFLGAVAGKIKEDGTLKDNCFVDTGLAGMDGVSCAGRAEPVSFEKFSKLENMPAEMLTFDLVLNADGKLVQKIPFSYGQDLSKLPLPEVPEKADCYGGWSDFDTTGRLSDIVVEAEYKHIVTITQSAEADGKLALALASGSFEDSAELSVEEQSTEKPVGAGKNAKIYKLTLKNTDVGSADMVSVRILNPGKSKANVWIYSDGKWSAVTAKQSGKYMLVEMTGAEGIFCIAEPDTVWIPFAAAGGAAVIALIIILCVRKSKKRKAAKSSSKKTVKNK